jgi:segregation and condensation protein A
MNSAPEAAGPDQATEAPIDADSLILRLEGFEGPLDLLLELARAQKVDLAKISILALVEQYLALVEGARRIRLELAADWLVMAAWLTWLKSRLLLPEEEPEAMEGEQAAEVLAERLRLLQAMRTAAAWLGTRPVLGLDVFRRGAPEDFTAIDDSRIAADLPGLIRAYLAALRRSAGKRTYRPRPVTLWSVQDALKRLGAMLGSMPDWVTLDRFLPESLGDPLARRAALASTLIAGLEMAKGGAAQLRQDEEFGPILVHRGGPEDDGNGEGDRPE